MSTVIDRFRRTAVMAAVLAAALGAVFVPQTQAHADDITLPDSPSYCDNPPPWATYC
jgi:hypothetical protein